MKKLLLSVSASLFAAALLVVPAVSSAALVPSPAPCAVVGTPFLNITQHITNDPDSGNHGNWATDAFTEHVSVWVGTDGATWCANASTTDGTFVTTGPLSPQAGVALGSGVTGTFTGGENYTIPSSVTLAPSYSTTTPQSIVLPDSAVAQFSWWVNQAFPSVASTSGSSYVNSYYLTYVTPSNGSWIDADTASLGDQNPGDITGSSTPVAPQTVTVTIDKFVDGKAASSTASTTASFPMHASWVIGGVAGSGDFALGTVGFNSPNAYEAVTGAMATSSSYSVNEDTTGAVVGASCSTGDPYALVGYSTGATLAAAKNGVVSTTTPNFATLPSNEYVIVWNKSCPKTPPPATTLKVHILKYLDGAVATAASSSNYLFPMTATWSATNIGAGAGTYVLGANFGGASNLYGADTAAMSTPADYTISEITNDVDSSSKVLPTTAACAVGNYRLDGYKTSAVSFADAATQPLSTTTPNFSQISNDRYVIVANETCTATTTPPTTGAGEIRGIKYADRDGDGDADDMHQRIPGVTIYLDTNNNGVLDPGEPSMVTNAQGVYDFTNLAPGTYYVREVVPPGWMQTMPHSGVYKVVLGAGKIVRNKNFGDFKLGTISGMKYNDANANGRKDANEVGLSGWTINLKGPHGFSTSTVTDASGDYSFSNLGAGLYTLSEVQQSGWTQTAHPGFVWILSGTTSTNDNFGNTQQKPKSGKGGRWNDDWGWNNQGNIWSDN